MLSNLKSAVKKRIPDRFRRSTHQSSVPEAILKHLPLNQKINVIDIGAHNGLFTTQIARKFKLNQAILIEPLPHKAAALRQKFSSPTYRIFEYVLTDHPGLVEFEVNDFDDTSSILRIRRDAPELSGVNLGTGQLIQCQALTLDQLFENEELSKSLSEIDLIKIDVQGAEHLVIEGAQRVFRHTKLIWTEVSFKPLYENSSTFFDIYERMSQLGYLFVELEPGFRSPQGELLQADALFINTDFSIHLNRQLS